MLRLRIPRRLSDIGVYGASLPRIGQAGWYLIIIRIPRLTPDWLAMVRFKPISTAALTQDVAFVHPLRPRLFGIKMAVAFLRGEACDCSIRLYGLHATPSAVSLSLVKLARPLAVAGAWLQNPERLRIAFRAVSGSPIERFRKAIAAAATRGQEFPKSYKNWSWMFDTWPDEQLGTIARSLPCSPAITAMVFHSGKGCTPALKATIDSLQDQFYMPSKILVIEAAEHSAGAGGKHFEGWVAVLQAGEVLPRHALLFLARAVAEDRALDIVLADEDRISHDGSRSNPLFKPQPSLTLMCSGLLSRGVWLIRSALLPANAAWAECARLQAWFGVHAGGQTERVRRVPYVLTHRLADAEQAPNEGLAECINNYLAASGVQAMVNTDFPMRLRWHGGNLAKTKVSIIVPSRLKGRVQVACILDVLTKTTYKNFEMFIIITQNTPLDDEQMKAARRLQSDRRVTVRLLKKPTFNYSLANNFAAAHTSGEFICLLNDDVSTMDGNWLDQMVARFSDPNTGIVGAKLYYPNMTVQHGGVIMGLSGLAEHASRFLPRGDPGYAWRAVLDQEFSCVTGACLLVRRSTFNKVDGLDEGFPTGFNDVDFCLRVRKLGHSVVFAASVELIHHETISFGHHYAQSRQQEIVDVRIMQERWAEVCRADPFHSPNLSLAGEAEWELAYPPRLGSKWHWDT